MENAQRIQSAKSRLADLVATVEDAARHLEALGPPCRTCRYRDGARCHNPVNHTVSVCDHELLVSGAGRCEILRGTNGLCGPEAILWEIKPWWRRAPWFVIVGCAVVMASILGAIFLFGPIAAFAMVGAFLVTGEWLHGRWSEDA